MGTRNKKSSAAHPEEPKDPNLYYWPVHPKRRRGGLEVEYKKIVFGK